MKSFQALVFGAVFWCFGVSDFEKFPSPCFWGSVLVFWCFGGSDFEKFSSPCFWGGVLVFRCFRLWNVYYYTKKITFKVRYFVTPLLHKTAWPSLFYITNLFSINSCFFELSANSIPWFTSPVLLLLDILPTKATLNSMRRYRHGIIGQQQPVLNSTITSVSKSSACALLIEY